MTVESLDQVIMTVLSTSALAACISNSIQMIFIYITLIFIYLLCMVLRRKRRPVWKRLFIAPLLTTILTYGFGSIVDGAFNLHIAYWIAITLSVIVVVHVSKLCDWNYTVENVKSLMYAFRGIKHDKPKTSQTVENNDGIKGGMDSDKPS